MTTSTDHIKDVFTVVTPQLGMHAVPVGPTLYQELDERFKGFAGHMLISTHEFEQDWSTWEMHPAGDEFVVLLTGAATLMLREPQGDRQVILSRAGSFVIVPQGTWHTARVTEKVQMLFITPGEGTRNEATPDG